MSSFEVKIRQIKVEPHPNADRLAVGSVDGYQFVVGKDQFQSGDLVVYIPEQAVVPGYLLRYMGLEGKLDGPDHNRVKAHKFRGVLSQGLAFDIGEKFADFIEGDEEASAQLAHMKGKPVSYTEDLAEMFGIVKWEPKPPKELQGHVRSAPRNSHTFAADIFQGYTDVENIKKYPGAFHDGEYVWMTEKLHGTCLNLGIIGGERVVSSLGVARRGFVLEEEADNTYWKIAKQCHLFEKLEALMRLFGADDAMLFGEIIGVQDLMYGLLPGELEFYAFDIKVDECSASDAFATLGFVDYSVFFSRCNLVGIPTVPLLYKGPYSSQVLSEHTSGPTTLHGGPHIREGLVVRPYAEQTDHNGRRVYKSINPDYLTRKNGTEYQ